MDTNRVQSLLGSYLKLQVLGVPHGCIRVMFKGQCFCKIGVLNDTDCIFSTGK